MPAMAPAAIVTGSSAGIGKAIAIRLAREGYRVALNYSADEQRAQDAPAECRETSPASLLIRADLGNPAAATALVQEAADRLGRIDVLVNNAARVIDGPPST